MIAYSTSLARILAVACVPLLCLGTMFQASAHLGPVPVSLKGAPVPEVPGLLDGPDPIVIDKRKAIVLGKALFWDTAVGSDGMACATCHFHAGADARVKNQISPTGKGMVQSGGMYERMDGQLRGPNSTLRRRDFPLTQVSDPHRESPFVRVSDDVVASAGTFGGVFRKVHLDEGSDDDCRHAGDPVFHVRSLGTRRIMQRNAPTVINAVFNHRNFWDGRANNVFNGSSEWGARDSAAGVWVRQGGAVVRERLNLVNSALASQAVAPATDPVEMSCEGRTLADLGRKLMWRRPLEKQKVHWNDSVLGAYSMSTPGNLAPGLNTYYVHLVRQAFNPKYWSSGQRGPFGRPAPNAEDQVPLAYNQFEANFAMFFGLALQLYQSTLVSDDSPFDRSRRDANLIPIDLTASEIRGMQAFRVAHCNLCHIGPVFTAAAVDTNARLVKSNPRAFGNETFTISTTHNVITRTPTFKGTGFVDTGFASTGVGEDEWDPGLAAQDAFGNPLSYSEQYLEYLTGNLSGVRDAAVAEIRPCDLQVPIAMSLNNNHPLFFTRANGIQPQAQPLTDCRSLTSAFVPLPEVASAELADPDTKRMLSVVDSTFKIPTLRNVELTGPFMHNGSMASLEEVIEFYARGGNFEGAGKQFGFVFPQPELEMDAGIRQDLLNFLKSLTDERVRYERAPFDHPELAVVHGHAGDGYRTEGGNPLGPDLSRDEFLLIPAVGAEGRSEPLEPFERLLPW
ncbi:cytochrome-c peroxidase [Nitrosovibrio sp. Nv17]|uniref:cytochrome-c peroxidase n=1 Tax=Nitrosovibrio sp. Nv17 TaxID=1855339 RepID=UPI0009085D0D|nr:cytochrome c peroxidase [Nitrosovibrio sp. Nv17]SFW16144.1 Di-haem cytochrome c peroxidase [Nitrosovibrio sp. Nv17]